MDKVQKIREEIEKLKSQLIRGACASQLAMETRCKEEAYDEVLAMFDSLQEEPVSEKKCLFTKDNYTNEDRNVLCKDCEEECEYSKKEPVSIDFEKELYKAFGQVKDFTLCMQIAKWFYDMGKNSQEPVSEDLEEAADEYADGENPTCPCEECLIKTFKAGAKWQEKQDQSTIELAEDHAMFAGMEKMKEEMMEKAVEVTVHIDAGGYPYIPQIELYDYDKDVPLAKEGDKYKVVLIKEE